jgi:hypothetical protein
MAIYYRFQNDQPRRGERVHCFTNIQDFKGFVHMMKLQDPDFYRMKYWEVEGSFVEEDEGDVIAEVVSAKQIKL